MLSEQEAEIDHLRRITSSEVSSSAEATPESSVSFLSPRGFFSAQRNPIYNSPVYHSPASREQSKHEDTPVSLWLYLHVCRAQGICILACLS